MSAIQGCACSSESTPLHTQMEEETQPVVASTEWKKALDAVVPSVVVLKCVRQRAAAADSCLLFSSASIEA